jgi:hypothetical protein
MTDAVQTLERELREIFGDRLASLATYGPPAPPAKAMHTMAIVEGLTKRDLDACAAKVKRWHDLHLATPLILAAHEFENSLDAFPLEFGAILADHTIVAGRNPFARLSVDPADLRRACEVQARSHLLHLREGYLETGGRADALSVLIVRSAAPFKALLDHIARLGGPSAPLSDSIARDVVRLADVSEISNEEARRIFPAYLDAVERLVNQVNGWGG